MSYEGYERVLCRNGHLFVANCYDSIFLDETDDSTYSWKCPICNEPMVWFESVDQTNNGGVSRVLIEYKTHECSCPTCGNQHYLSPTQYYIPQGKTIGDVEPFVPFTNKCSFKCADTGEIYDTFGEACEALQEYEEEREEEWLQSMAELGL